MAEEKTNTAAAVTAPETAAKRAKTAETIATGIAGNKLSLDSALNDPEITLKLAKFNMTKERIQAMANLAGEVATLQAVQKKEQGEAVAATVQLNTLREAADDLYSDYLELARFIFKNNEAARKALVLDGVRKKAFAAWGEEARLFYTNALNNKDIFAEFLKNGITADMLKAGEAALKKALDYKVNAEKEKAEAIRATELRDAKLEELETFMAGFRAFARVALKGRADLLKKIGV